MLGTWKHLKTLYIRCKVHLCSEIYISDSDMYKQLNMLLEVGFFLYMVFDQLLAGKFTLLIEVALWGLCIVPTG